MNNILCYGQCDGVPDEVTNAVIDAVKNVPVGDRGDERVSRAAYLAPRMAAEGWRFCPCYPMVRTQYHELIFGLVNTHLANQLAYRAAQSKVGDQIARVPRVDQSTLRMH